MVKFWFGMKPDAFAQYVAALDNTQRMLSPCSPFRDDWALHHEFVAIEFTREWQACSAGWQDYLRKYPAA